MTHARGRSLPPKSTISNIAIDPQSLLRFHFRLQNHTETRQLSFIHNIESDYSTHRTKTTTSDITPSSHNNNNNNNNSKQANKQTKQKHTQISSIWIFPPRPYPPTHPQSTKKTPAVSSLSLSLTHTHTKHFFSTHRSPHLSTSQRATFTMGESLTVRYVHHPLTPPHPHPPTWLQSHPTHPPT